MQSKINAKLSFIYALICVLTWSFLAVVARFGQVDLDNFQLLFWSNCLSAIVILIAAIFFSKTTFKSLFKITLKQMLACALLGCLGCVLYYVFLYFGYAHESPSIVVITQYSWPVMVVLLSALLLGERLTWIKIAGCLGGIFSVALVVTNGQFKHIAVQSPSTIMLVLVGAFCFALFSVLSKKLKLDAFVSTFWFFVFASLLSLVLMLVLSRFALPSQRSIVPVVVNGALINGLSYVLWIKAMQLGRASTLAPLVFIAPVLAFVWIALFFKTALSWVAISGLALCVASGLACVFEWGNKIKKTI